jgi:hypothetical protein
MLHHMVNTHVSVVYSSRSLCLVIADPFDGG